MTFFRDLFGRPAPSGVQETLRVLDCSDLFELAGMYGEARERGNTKLMETINERVGVVIKEQELSAPEAKPCSIHRALQMIAEDDVCSP